ncbi:transcriptional repressor NrdR [Candidatus Woesearchaeota archaeon]|jgi:transcriptional repressor NrdR|nr:transcriptional repressor NrdR [Candidatus Woesearchaeota archaeon]MBT3438913.1 transcriptional repressor NrdR [Candidatus Woesearchaeota archaeon]MBT4058201.1 transcriptional repressor NrdR [Candidatus Woesearchaeota archaeon]MBT4206834.1 transcriptional repressor NrdR [Candidatus Woesearchaeota archaeon]MBT4731008.1 transcriptional repressor NrdR [Candidatus Woesearchaeota archaeon]
MLCPYCQNQDTKVIDSRETENEEATRRRRECLLCKKRFTTYERVETDLRVIKKDGTVTNYQREKLKSGILRACEKRPVKTETIHNTVNKIEAELRSKQKTDIPSKLIGELAMKELKKLDKIAYIRFASVYKDFEDIGSFEDELKKLK